MRIKIRNIQKILVFCSITIMIILAGSACRSADQVALETEREIPVATVMSYLPSIHIIALPEGSVITNPGDITISVNVANFDLVDKLGQASQPGQGHIFYFLDEEPPTTPFQQAIYVEGSSICTTATSYTWKGVEEGEHKFSVELVNNDHTPLNPTAIDSRTVIVRRSGS
jgi:hypothetical protein